MKSWSVSNLGCYCHYCLHFVSSEAGEDDTPTHYQIKDGHAQRYIVKLHNKTPFSHAKDVINHLIQGNTLDELISAVADHRGKNRTFCRNSRLKEKEEKQLGKVLKYGKSQQVDLETVKLAATN